MRNALNCFKMRNLNNQELPISNHRLEFCYQVPVRKSMQTNLILENDIFNTFPSNRYNLSWAVHIPMMVWISCFNGINDFFLFRSRDLCSTIWSNWPVLNRICNSILQRLSLIMRLFFAMAGNAVDDDSVSIFLMVADYLWDRKWTSMHEMLKDFHQDMVRAQWQRISSIYLLYLHEKIINTNY